jgi:hypothetical protein
MTMGCDHEREHHQQPRRGNAEIRADFFWEFSQDCCNLISMSAVQEIQEAITQLPEEARMTLLQWIHSQEEAEPLSDDPELLRQAEEGARQLDAGQGISLEQARRHF